MGDVVIAGVWGLVSAASARVIAVPSEEAPDLPTAVAKAADGDVIELSAGVWTAPGSVLVAITVIGVDGRDATTVVASALGVDQPALFDASAPLTLQSLTLDPTSPYGGIGVIAGGDAHLKDVRFVGGGQAVLGLGAEVILDAVDLETGVAGDPDAVGVAVELVGGSLVARDVLSRSPARPWLRVAEARSAFLVRVRSCHEGGIELHAEIAELNAVLLPNAVSPALQLSGAVTVRNAVLGGGIETFGGSLEVWSTAFLHGASVGNGAAVTGGYSLFEGGPVPPGLAAGAVVTQDAGLVEVEVFDGDADPVELQSCRILAPGPRSPAIDAGDPASADRNGTRADIGATGGPEGYVVDADGDGALSDVDCADADPAVAPGADEVAYDGVDQDCDGGDLNDVDGDGYPLGPDCDDADPAIAPGRADPLGDGVDQDCDGNDGPSGTTGGPGPDDLDGDGHPAGADCDDADPEVHPGAAEDLGPSDRDCDGWADPSTPFRARGCSCAAASGGPAPAVPLPLLLLLLGPAVRRRRWTP